MNKFIPRIKLSQFQYKELAKFWFDLSKLTFGSLILKLFEPTLPKISLSAFGTLLSGLILTVIFGMLGMRFSKEVKQ